MDCLIERRAKVIDAGFECTQCVFDISRENKDIFSAIASKDTEFQAAFEFVLAKIPTPKSASVCTDNHFYRLPGHNRSFCYALAEGDSIMDAPVLVFKGTEPLLRDFRVLVGWMSQAPLRRSSRVMTDHFPLAEGKIPGALSLKEALREAEIGLEIQKRHLKYYGELARVPTPLLVHSFSEHRNRSCASLLQEMISQAAFERISPLLREGLAVYVYYYPAAPVRANYWGGMASAQVTQYVQKTFSEEVAVRGWARLIARLLYLGFLPYSVRNEGLGACMDFGNATLDGGFCDPDSITPIDGEADDEFIKEGFIQSLNFLQSTVQLLLGLAGKRDLYPSIDEFACRQYVRHLLDDAFKSEARRDLHLDERVACLMAPKSIADVKLCIARKNRTAWYAQFAKRAGQLRDPTMTDT